MIKFTDSMPIGRTRKTKEGFLVAKIRSARTGVQLYRASEIGDMAIAAGFDANDVVRVNRPESEVFSKKAMQTLAHAPLTVNHPPEMVTSDNWSDYAVGEVSGDVLRDGESLVVSVIAKDAAGIAAIQSTHKQVSWGYVARLRDAADKSIADFEMYDFEYNHISAVPAGRAGPEYGFDDAAQIWGASPVTVEDNKMTVELKTVVLGDEAVQVEAKFADAVTAALKDYKTAVEAKDAEIAVKDAKIADLEAAKLTDADIDALVEEKAAKKKKREEVEAKVGDAAKDFTDAQIDVAHALLGTPAFADNSVREALSIAKPVADAAEAAHAAMIARLQSGYKGTK